MKAKKYVVGFLAVLVMVAAAGCGRSVTYGERVPAGTATALKDILAHPKEYAGKAVTVKGSIAQECPTGCWFNFKEGDAIVYVDLEPSGFAIPQKAGRDVTVAGTVAIKDGKTILIGKGVEVR
ncbi:MAG: hypothetical protein WCG78_03620 [Candidatus Omnitrophota bacterium]